MGERRWPSGVKRAIGRGAGDGVLVVTDATGVLLAEPGTMGRGRGRGTDDGA